MVKNADAEQYATIYCLCLRSYAGELGPKHWPNTRYEYVMKLKQAALNFSRKRWADYILVHYEMILVVTALQDSYLDLSLIYLMKFVPSLLLLLHPRNRSNHCLSEYRQYNHSPIYSLSFVSSVFLFQYADTDNILTNPDTLNLLIAENKSVISPMLDSQGAYSNYWCGITPQVSNTSECKSVINSVIIW